MTIWLHIRYWAEFCLLRSIIGMIRLMPLDTAVKFSAYWWRILAARGRRHKRALNNLAMAFPEKSEEERESIAIAMWENLGRVMAETMQMDRILKNPDCIEIANPEILERYQGKMGSAICVSMHSGNWELAMWPLASKGMKPAGVYRLVKNPLVDQYLRSQRKELYPGGLFAKGSGAGIHAGRDTARQIGSYVRKGGRLGFLADQWDRNGVEVPFFGIDAKSPPFPAMLARRIGTRLWIGRCVRIGTQSNFRVEMHEIKVPRTDDQEADIKQIITEIQSTFEGWIREYPEQFMWSNRRWS
ncbi:MAG: lysophospholipid acyltransferase family protein [Rhizobiales bacterium]|nr:lysophospholipid acyltransferase family protein [Hyphomicrobiales bacterium]